MKKTKRSAKYFTVLCLALSVLACVLAFPARSQRRADPSPPQKKPVPSVEKAHVEDPPGRIAFASDRTGNFEIYVMNGDGGGLVRVTNDPADDTDPTWSADGTKLAFVSTRDGNKEIYTVNDDGTGITRLTNNLAEDFSPAWSLSVSSPRIAFVSHRTGNDEIFTMNPDGSSQTNITNNAADDNDPGWLLTAAGSLISYASNRDGDKFEIYRANADGTVPQRLTTNGSNDVQPAWPPGRFFFQTDRDGNDEIYLMNANGTSQSNVTNNAAFDIDPTSSSDGARIVWVSNRDGSNNLEIYGANANGASVVRLTNDAASDINPAVQPIFAPSTIQFGAASATVNETAGSLSISITRTGDTSAAAVVDLTTVNGTALDGFDFTSIFRTLTFAPGETSKTLSLLIINDSYFEPDETLTLSLSQPVGAALGTPSTMTVTISSDDPFGNNPNPIDNATFFVRQHYLDFLNREPDAPGLAHWVGEITMCSTPANRLPGETEAQCVDRKRTNTSGAFILSNEFLNSGNFLIRLNWGSLGKDRAVGRKCIVGQHSALDAVCRPLYAQYIADMGILTDGIVVNNQLDPNAMNNNKRNFTHQFITRAEFLAAYPVNMPADQYVDKLVTFTGVPLTSDERTALISDYNSPGPSCNGFNSGRACVLFKMVDGTTTIAGGVLRFDTRYGKAYFDKEFNAAFVFIEYIAYLRRNPDQAGYDHWLAKLNFFGNFVDAQMVRAFLVSDEYRRRFGP